MKEARSHAQSPDDWAELTVQDRMVLQYRAEQFYYAEAALLDARRYADWLELIADDVHYWMPIRRTVTQRNIDREFTKQGDAAFFDDSKGILAARVKKLSAGSAWSEDPPSRSRHFVTNVTITGTENGDLAVQSCFCLYRTRLNSEVDHWTGRREDLLRPHGESFLLSRRYLYLDQTLIQATNMSTLF